jgi:hypothetical protein
MKAGQTILRRHRWLTAAAFTGLLVLLASPTHAQFGKGKQAPAPEAKPAPKSAQLTNDAWQKAPMTPIKPGEIDALIMKELNRSKITPAPLTTDEQFIRRVSLDLTGKLPQPADISAFAADTDPAKRTKFIDKLLESDAFARHWARYWRDVISAKIVNRQGMVAARAFEEWMTSELKKNAHWDQIVKSMLTAEGESRFDKPLENGSVFFLLAFMGAEAANDRAAETSRVFLGIQIQCAQCHDHPFDQWKQVQFHELAGFFARTRERAVLEEQKVKGFTLVSAPAGEHQMAEKNDPNKKATTYPKFLDGKAPGRNLNDKERRAALAASVIDKKNYWFAGAYVNRMWGELMGQSFYQPVDDMGPLKEAVFPEVLARLSAGFRATDYDIKEMYRTILNTRAYQRQIRPGESAEEHLHFAAAYPKRLGADALWDSLVGALGPIGGGGPLAGVRPMGPFGGAGGMEGQFKQLFAIDPSLKADEVEGSIPQALMLMNNPAINQRMRGDGNTMLARILKEHPKDAEALDALYVQVLARKPSSAERSKCEKYIAKVGARREAFEDLLWAMINSTEFQTKR